MILQSGFQQKLEVPIVVIFSKNYKKMTKNIKYYCTLFCDKIDEYQIILERVNLAVRA